MASASLSWLLLLLLDSASRSIASWCVCKQGVSDALLQKTLDYACGAGADCNPTRQSGPCFNPNTVRAHCNYAVNSYFQKNRQAPTACDFAGTATVTSSDPSIAGCAYPASASSSSVIPTTTPTTPASGIPATATPNGGSPLVTTPTTGVLGGTNNGLGFNNNFNAATTLAYSVVLSYLLFVLISFSFWST